jgi:hypothetical protein
MRPATELAATQIADAEATALHSSEPFAVA